jgi:hypothetical protein
LIKYLAEKAEEKGFAGNYLLFCSSLMKTSTSVGSN